MSNKCVVLFQEEDGLPARENNPALVITMERVAGSEFHPGDFSLLVRRAFRARIS